MITIKEKIYEAASYHHQYYLAGLHITHDDADGVACGVVSKFIKNLDTDVINCSIADVNQTISQMLDSELSLVSYDAILITDIVISDNNAERLNAFCEERGIALEVYDHHETNHLGELYEWAHIKSTDDEGIPMSAAKYLCTEMKDVINEKVYPHLSVMMNDVSRYDTGEWTRHPKAHPDEDQYHILNLIRGPQNLYDMLVSALNTYKHIENTNEASNLIRKEYAPFAGMVAGFKEKKDRVLEHVLGPDNITIFTGGINSFTHKYALVIVSDDFAHYEMRKVIQEMPDIDVVVGIYPKSRKLSFRTNHDDVDVSELAKSFGGGGHRNIAGATLDKENFMRILKVYYGTDVEGI